MRNINKSKPSCQKSKGLGGGSISLILKLPGACTPGGVYAYVSFLAFCGIQEDQAAAGDSRCSKCCCIRATSVPASIMMPMPWLSLVTVNKSLS